MLIDCLNECAENLIYKKPEVTMTKILVIEDEPNVRANIAEILELADFEPIVAQDGSEGVQLAQENLPDLIICDIMMPKLDGYGVVQALRKQPNTESIPFIFLSAKAERGDFRQGMQLGADDYLTKPFSMDELLAAIAVRLERSAKQEAKLQAVSEQLKHLENFDDLTGLPKESVLAGDQGYLSEAISRITPSNPLVPFFLLGLDRFTRVNEVLGYSQGDQLLQKIADRLSKFVRSQSENIPVVRLGGDEFAIMFPPIRHQSVGLEIAQQLLDPIAQPLEIEGRTIPVTGSIGIAFYPTAVTIEELRRKAAIALKEAKQNGGNCCKIYSPPQFGSNSSKQQLILAADLHRVWKEKNLPVVYQPRIDLRKKKMIGLAAVLKWTHPLQGEIAPATTFALAEESGLAVALGEWVLQNAIKQLKNWLSSKVKWPVAVSLPAPMFNAPDIAQVMVDLVQKAGIYPSSLELEVAANTIANAPNLNKMGAKLQQLKSSGFTITIGQFNLEHSSWDYLGGLAIDKIKIDRQILAHANQNEPLLSAIGKVASSFSLKVVADGVETEEQVKVLRRVKFDEIQRESIFTAQNINQSRHQLAKLF